MRKFKDLSGKKFGKLISIEIDWDMTNKCGHTYWKCRCECGRIKSIRIDNLTSGASTSCGLCYNDYANKKFNKLTALRKTHVDKNGHQYWLFKCDCGNLKEIEINNVTSGKVQSCGCLHSEVCSSLGEDLIGMKFGLLTVKELSQTSPRKYKCICDCGTYTIVDPGNLKNGHTQSCGCIKSLGELKIRQLFNDNKILFKPEYIFSDLSNRRFDFGVFDNCALKYVVEYHGKQHYIWNDTWHMSYEEFLESQQRDKEKENYCLSNNIPLIRIPYWHYENLCLEDLLLETTTFLVTT